MARTRTVRRWKRNMEVSGDHEYVETLATLSEGSVRRNFNPYTDIDWNDPEFAVTGNDPRWVLPVTDPLAGIPGIRRNHWRSRSRSECGVRPTSRRSVCTSKAS